MKRPHTEAIANIKIKNNLICIKYSEIQIPIKRNKMVTTKFELRFAEALERIIVKLLP